MVTTAGLGSIFIVGAAANVGRIFLIQRAGQRVIANLRKQIFNKLTGLEMAFFDKAKTGELVNRLASDTEIVGKALTDNVSNGLRAFGSGIIGVSLMTYISPQLAGVFLLVVPPIGLMSVVYGRAIKRIATSTQDALAEAASCADETVGNMRSVRSFAWEELMSARYGVRVDKALELAITETKARAGFFGFAGLTGNLGLLAVLGYGGTLTSAGALTIGDLSAFLLYTAYVGVSITGLASFHADLMKGLGASDRLFKLLEKTGEPSDGFIIPDDEFRGKVEFEHVNFQFPTRDVAVLSDLNLVIEPGSVQALVGGSGSGKSTLAALMLRLYDVDSGKVYVDGWDVQDLDAAWLRSQTGVVEQRPVLFSGTILENLKLGQPDASFEQVVHAAEQANAYVGRKPPSATKNLLEVTDGLRRPP